MSGPQPTMGEMFSMVPAPTKPETCPKCGKSGIPVVDRSTTKQGCLVAWIVGSLASAVAGIGLCVCIYILFFSGFANYKYRCGSCKHVIREMNRGEPCCEDKEGS